MDKLYNNTRSYESPSRKRKKKRNKELTKQHFLEAIGLLIKEEGMKGLTVNKVATVAGHSKRLIYDYFGNLDGLIREFLHKSDHWLSYEERMEKIRTDHRGNHGRELAALMLKNHLYTFYSDALLQEVCLMELANKDNGLLIGLHRLRERVGDKVFAIFEGYFRGTVVNIRMIEALLIGGINYLVLHSSSIGTTFCGIDINDMGDRRELRATLEQITQWAYDHAKKD